jgi:hypothetical protein
LETRDEEIWREPKLRSTPTTLQPKLILIVEDYGLKARIRKTSKNKGRDISGPAFAYEH